MINKIKLPVVALLLITTALVFYFIKDPFAWVLVLSIFIVVIILPKIIENPSFGLFLIAFLLPFERFPTFELSGLTIKINHFMVVLTLVGWLIHAGLTKKLKIPRGPLLYFTLLFISVLMISIPVAPNFMRAVQVFIIMIFMFVILFLNIAIIDDKTKLIYVLKGLLLGAIVSSIIGIYQFGADAIGLPNEISLLKEGYDKSTFGFARIQSVAAEPLYFANYLFIPLFVALLLVIRKTTEKIISRNLAIGLIILMLVNFVLAISRGAYLALLISGLFLIIFQAKKILTLKIILPAVIAFGLVATGSYLALVRSEPEAIDEFIGHALVADREKGESIVSRINTSKQALKLYQDNSLIGVGIGNYGPAVAKDPYERPKDGWAIVNNEYLEILAENGIIGFLSFLLLIGLIFFTGLSAFFKSKDSVIKSVIIGLLFAFFAILVQYASFSTLVIIHIWFLIGLIGASSNLALKNNE